MPSTFHVITRSLLYTLVSIESATPTLVLSALAASHCPLLNVYQGFCLGWNSSGKLLISPPVAGLVELEIFSRLKSEFKRILSVIVDMFYDFSTFVGGVLVIRTIR
jgi:hypothetical protein